MPNYVVEGADKKTGQPRTLGVLANDEVVARQWARKQNIYVSGIRLAQPEESRLALVKAEPPPRPPLPELTMVQLFDVPPGVAFSFGFYAFLGAFVASLILSVIVAVIGAIVMQAVK